MRKYVLSLAAVFAMVGFVLAAEVTFMKWDSSKNELTVKEGDKEATYKVTDKTKVKVGEKDGDISEMKKRWEKAGDKMSGKSKMEITTEKDTITEIKVKEGKKKQDK